MELKRSAEAQVSECAPEQRIRLSWARNAAVWTDVVRGAKTLRLAISAYSLKLLVEDAQKTMMQRQRLNEVKAWIDALEPLGQCAIRAEPRSEDVLVHFRLGRICDE